MGAGWICRARASTSSWGGDRPAQVKMSCQVGYAAFNLSVYPPVPPSRRGSPSRRSMRPSSRRLGQWSEWPRPPAPPPCGHPPPLPLTRSRDYAPRSPRADSLWYSGASCCRHRRRHHPIHHISAAAAASATVMETAASATAMGTAAATTATAAMTTSATSAAAVAAEVSHRSCVRSLRIGFGAKPCRPARPGSSTGGRCTRRSCLVGGGWSCPVGEESVR